MCLFYTSSNLWLPTMFLLTPIILFVTTVLIAYILTSIIYAEYLLLVQNSQKLNQHEDSRCNCNCQSSHKCIGFSANRWRL
ncbi:hypothetical protein EB796_018407 [Bugula neritina]|uniref:Uncharacterized protein n=1 Tax=Bugula neritina TaxID=10212 RepID=A0A7J7JAL0_BUGNE|nr:hypothetical protein EB796_018407 [Bugula neritina]